MPANGRRDLIRRLKVNIKLSKRVVPIRKSVKLWQAMVSVTQRFSKWVLWPRRGPHQVSKGRQVNDEKLGSRSNFWVAHRNCTACIKHFKFKIDSYVPFSSKFPAEHETTLCFIAFPASYLLECGFMWMICLLSQVCNHQDVMRREMIFPYHLAHFNRTLKNLQLFTRPKELADYNGHY